jgi:pimeloyl-ACP methyl ester carboxylesterase
MSADNLSMRSGRSLEVWQYGDPSGHPVFFFHGLIGSHFQASYISESARRSGLRVVAPNRPGVGQSEFTKRTDAFEVVADVEDIATALGLDEFSVIGISGGAPYALATLQTLGQRVRTATLISGMGPLRLPGALQGMRRSDRIALELGARYPLIAMRQFGRWGETVRADPRRFLTRFLGQLVAPDQRLFRETGLYDLFLQDLTQVFVDGRGAESLAQELSVYRNFRPKFDRLPADRRVTLWHGLADDLVPPAMAWAYTRRIPNCEAHFVPGGHFVAYEIAELVIERLRRLLDDPALCDGRPSP